MLRIIVIVNMLVFFLNIYVVYIISRPIATHCQLANADIREVAVRALQTFLRYAPGHECHLPRCVTAKHACVYCGVIVPTCPGVDRLQADVESGQVRRTQSRPSASRLHMEAGHLIV